MIITWATLACVYYGLIMNNRIKKWCNICNFLIVFCFLLFFFAFYGTRTPSKERLYGGCKTSLLPSQQCILYFHFLWELHYENMPIQIYWNFHLQKQKIFRQKNLIFFYIFAQNIDCGYSLGGSNEYPQSMFWAFCSKHRLWVLVRRF